jgi:hypothetical protein
MTSGEILFKTGIENLEENNFIHVSAPFFMYTAFIKICPTEIKFVTLFE